MNILFISTGNLEDFNRNGMYVDLLKEFKKNDHNLYVLSTRERKYKLPTVLEENDGVHFLKVKTGNFKKVKTIEKGISTLSIEPLFLRAVKKYYADVKFDLVLYTTPPITFTRVVKYIKKRDNAKSYLMLKDIFPQNAVDLNVIGANGIIHKLFKRKERKLYEVSDYIGCMSSANVEYLLRNNSNIDSVTEVCPNTVTPIDYSDNQKAITSIRNKYNLPLNKSIFIYGGNLGKPQGVDFLIECIKKNEENKNEFFLIIGSGTEFHKIKEFFQKEEPNNAKLLESIPKVDYDQLVYSCDVGLIFLDKRFTIPNFPSRLLSYMQASMPVLSATDPNTDIGDIIEKGKFGYSCISDNVERFNDLVIRLSDKNSQEIMGKNARKYLEENYTSKHSYDIIMSHFK